MTVYGIPGDLGPLNTAAVTRAVWQHFVTQSWWGLTEIEAPAEPGSDTSRRADLVFMRTPKREGLGVFETLAVEVKTSRADFLRDVRDADKQAAIRRTCHRFAYAAPDGLIRKHELPDEAGLIVVQDREPLYGEGKVRQVKWAQRAPYTDTEPDVPAWLLRQFMQRASWSEGRKRGWTLLPGDPEGDAEALRLELAETRARLTRAQDATMRLTDERTAWRALAATAVRLPCAWCGETIRATRLTAMRTVRWRHVDAAADGTCATLQRLTDPEFLVVEPPMPADDMTPSSTQAATLAGPVSTLQP